MRTFLMLACIVISVASVGCCGPLGCGPGCDVPVGCNECDNFGSGRAYFGSRIYNGEYVELVVARESLELPLIEFVNANQSNSLNVHSSAEADAAKPISANGSALHLIRVIPAAVTSLLVVPPNAVLFAGNVERCFVASVADFTADAITVEFEQLQRADVVFHPAADVAMR